MPRLSIVTCALVAAIAAIPAVSHADGGMNSQIGQSLPGPSGTTDAAPAPVIVYPAANVITMERDRPSASAVAVSGKRIVAVGSLDEVKRALGKRPFTVDDTFKSRVVMPGLIDQHLHPILGALTLSVEIIAPEDWSLPGRTIKAANNAQEYVDRLKDAESRLKDPKKWLITWGYHSRSAIHGPSPCGSVPATSSFSTRRRSRRSV
jgi:hypothetical protein